MDVAQGGIEAQGIGLGLIEQHPLEAALPQVQCLGGERGLAHAAQAGDYRHRLYLVPAAGADELRPQPNQLPGAADKVLMPPCGQLRDLVQAGSARI